MATGKTAGSVRKHELSPQSIFDDLLKGKHYGVFVDDTGGSGSKQFWSLPHDRVTYVAVVFQPAVCRGAIREYWDLLNSTKVFYRGLTELHFVDVYQGKGCFDGVDWSARLAIIQNVVRIFQTYQPALIVQSLTKMELPRWQDSLRQMARETVPQWKGTRAWGFNIFKHEDMVLLILFGKIMQMIDDLPKHAFRPARVIVDEGFKKAGYFIRSRFYEPEFADGGVYFASSLHFFMLQLADFAAYVLNKTQQLLSVNPLSPVERSFLKAVQPIIPLFRGLTPAGTINIHLDSGERELISVVGAPQNEMQEQHLRRFLETAFHPKKKPPTE